MAKITPDTPVTEIAARFPHSARVFERHRLEYCQGGRQPLAQVCAERGLSVETLLAELAAAAPQRPDELEAWRQVPLSEVIEHAVGRYHARMHEDLPHVTRLAERAVSAEARRHPELVEVARVLAMLRSALEEHTAKEERLLFPLIRQLARGAAAARPPVATLAPAIQNMTREHETVVAALAQLHKMTRGFKVPAGTGNAMRSLYHELAELEQGLQRHMRIEDEILFPRALEIERSLVAGRSSGKGQAKTG